MWIFTQIGFASIVEHRQDEELVMVRSRAHIDLQRIADKYFIGVEIIRTPNADYPFRFVTSKSALRDALGRGVGDVNYTNFKDAATGGGSADARLRKRVYEDVWTEMHRLEELNSLERS